jgi:hypothetical protein
MHEAKMTNQKRVVLVVLVATSLALGYIAGSEDGYNRGYEQGWNGGVHIDQEKTFQIPAPGSLANYHVKLAPLHGEVPRFQVKRIGGKELACIQIGSAKNIGAPVWVQAQQHGLTLAWAGHTPVAQVVMLP